MSTLKKMLLFTILLLLLAKYIEMVENIFGTSSYPFVVRLSGAGALFIIGIGIRFLEGKWKVATITLGILGFITVLVWHFYPSPIIHFLWNIFIFTGFFLPFYNQAHYEIKKFPAFSHSFMIIYILTESISLWRKDTYPPLFLAYLTFILSMYIIGIIKMKD